MLNFPLDVNRNRAPAHLRSGVEWPAHGTQSICGKAQHFPMAPAGAEPPATRPLRWAPQAPEPADCDFKVAITSAAILRAAAVSVPGTLMAPTTGWPPPP